MPQRSVSLRIEHMIYTVTGALAAHASAQGGPVRCVATLASGRPCSREAKSPSDVCSRHAAVRRSRDARSFYTSRISEEERQALAVAAQLEGVDAEIAVLRVLIRRVVDAGDLEAARRGIDTLCRTLLSARKSTRVGLLI